MGCKVFVWGLNDKDQLGGLKGSKVKLPVLSEFVSQLRPIHIAGGSKSLFIVSQEGKVRFFLTTASCEHDLVCFLFSCTLVEKVLMVV